MKNDKTILVCIIPLVLQFEETLIYWNVELKDLLHTHSNECLVEH